tara:strand:+ start:491 stop:670 length:180 start_codon:yes stop_codon:yes gene_type:complete
MTLKDLKAFAEAQSNKYQNHDEDIRGLYFLAISEVEDGQPETHEVELAMESIKQLVENE